MQRRSELKVPAASLSAEGAPEAMVNGVQREAVARILAEVCDATGANVDESIKVFLQNYWHIRANPSLSMRHHGEPPEPVEDLPARKVFASVAVGTPVTGRPPR
jgi:hypothetical protein